MDVKQVLESLDLLDRQELSAEERGTTIALIREYVTQEAARLALARSNNEKLLGQMKSLTAALQEISGHVLTPEGVRAVIPARRLFKLSRASQDHIRTFRKALKAEKTCPAV